MSETCEKCGTRPAIVHITEMMDGMILERDLCEECSNVRSTPEIPPLQWSCHCGRTIEWCHEIPNCGHGAACYTMAGDIEQEVAACSCGMHYIARFPVWRCEICGRASLFPPRLGGSKGFLRDYLYGSSHTTKVEIKGVKGESEV